MEYGEWASASDEDVDGTDGGALKAALSPLVPLPDALGAAARRMWVEVEGPGVLDFRLDPGGSGEDTIRCVAARTLAFFTPLVEGGVDKEGLVV